MLISDKIWDRKLHIRTMGRIDSFEDKRHHAYEPTAYSVLRRFAESGIIGERSHLIDYGAGKGRAAFFLHHACGCRVTGVEFNEKLYSDAQENRETYCGDAAGIRFVLEDAERFFVPPDADVFWFFNPFPVTVLRTVVTRILKSCHDAPRRVRLCFYYPTDEAIAYLAAREGLAFYDEIDCRDLFRGDNPRERILIFEDEDVSLQNV